MINSRVQVLAFRINKTCKKKKKKKKKLSLCPIVVKQFPTSNYYTYKSYHHQNQITQTRNLTKEIR
ncbi:hypothetical protein Hanom_Chr12g01073391 [Helianthus anomalus]